MSLEEIKLSRPLVFFDLETTGTRPEFDRIIEIAIIKHFPDGRDETVVRKINPQMHIPEEASAVHGIYDADVAECPTFGDIAGNLLNYLADCDVAGYNIIKFDIPMLVNEFRRSGLTFDLKGRKVVDVFNIFCKLYPRNLSSAYEFFCGRKLEDAHSAAADTSATLEVLAGQLARHSELPRDLAELAAYSDNRRPDSIDAGGRFRWSGNDAVINFGKNYGKKLSDIAVNDPGFLRWIIRSDFPEEVEQIASDALTGRYPVKPTTAE
jgi:DNA polymerase-3 subunit epsilon